MVACATLGSEWRARSLPSDVVSDPRRLLLICGSLRDGSTNSAALRTARAVAPEDVEAVIFDGMSRLPHFNPDDDHEPLHPAVAWLRTQLAAADAVLFSAPEYAGALPGSFKNLLDWTVGGVETSGKPAAWINVASNGRGAAASDELRTVLTYTDFSVVDKACVQVPVARDAVGEDGEVEDPSVRSEIAAAIETLLADSVS
jgi:NAD(P)H-dependent FMN reductase